MQTKNHYDVVIVGAGLAGLALARQLLLNSDKRILLLEKRAAVPPVHQKVGESCVQVSGYYFSKVLDLEEHLLREHFMKYNLRFYWKTTGHENRSFEDYSQSYIRMMSNIPTYQLNRNKIEAELLRLNFGSENFTFCAAATDLHLSLSEADCPHELSFTYKGNGVTASAGWVVDTSGRVKVLARQLSLRRQNPIRHGTVFLWVEGLINFEKLTDLSPRELRLNRDRSDTGHLPFWLATNHFCGEGFWFWVIPLQGITSLGLVYDNTLIDRESVSTPQKLIDWVCQEFPLFARDLPFRKILDHSAIKDFSYDCAQTISASRWALSGEAGRFTDPLYSPGGDLISLHNTLITDAILTKDANELTLKLPLYEQLMKSLYEAYVPSYGTSYDVLGDQEAMTLKYTWELSVYFSFYVFPFINELFTDRHFLVSYLNKLSRLGPINRKLHDFLSAYYQWKKLNGQVPTRKIFNDFTALIPLRRAESTFYNVGVTAEEARQVLDAQLDNLKELARFIIAHVYSVICGERSAVTNRALVESIDLYNFRFDAEEMRERYSSHSEAEERFEWTFDPFVLDLFRATAEAASPGEQLDEDGRRAHCEV
jgi:2-polyprenyl-6-methoxyphenol hydroxylase-like FAD-dependent oxidoreductase